MSVEKYPLMTVNTRVVSDRDIKVKCRFYKTLDINIEKGKPFYPENVFYAPPWQEKGIVCVPSLGARNEFPIEWFSLYDPGYEMWVTEAHQHCSSSVPRSGLGEIYYALKSGKLKAPEVGRWSAE